MKGVGVDWCYESLVRWGRVFASNHRFLNLEFATPCRTADQLSTATVALVELFVERLVALENFYSRRRRHAYLHKPGRRRIM